MTARSILTISYGLEIGWSDPISDAAEAFTTASFEAATMPVALLMDAFPLVQHLPSWMPGIFVSLSLSLSLVPSHFQVGVSSASYRSGLRLRMKHTRYRLLPPKLHACVFLSDPLAASLNAFGRKQKLPCLHSYRRL